MGSKTAIYVAAAAGLIVLAATVAALALAREQVGFDGWPSPPEPHTPKVECRTCR